MELDIFRTLWGVTAPLESYAEQLRNVGFNGVEARIAATSEERKAFRQALDNAGLELIAILFTGGDVIPDQAESSAEHLQRMDRLLDAAAPLSPRFINVLPGNDRWGMAEQVEFFGKAMELADKHGILCSFETHRATSLYSPWVTLDLIRQLPELKFTTDISHWVVVCERLLNHPSDDLTPFIDRVHHVQARVGYDQGPQTPHPGAPEYAPALAFHQSIWEAVWRKHIEKGYERTTLTTEFGPDGYLHHLPYTNVPVADLWSLNDWMAIEERKHFTRFMQQSV